MIKLVKDRMIKLVNVEYNPRAGHSLILSISHSIIQSLNNSINLSFNIQSIIKIVTFELIRINPI